jgi:hypothetical protein
LQVGDEGTDPTRTADTCVFTTDATTAGNIVCEGDTANTSESRMDFGDPTGDRVFTLPDADSFPFSTGDKGDVTINSATDIQLDADVISAAEMADADHGDISWSGGVAAVDANSVALTTDTSGNYAAGDAEAGAALTGDSATSFFSTGTLEDARVSAVDVVGVQVLTSGSAATYTPTSGTTFWKVTCTGGGGGGGGADSDGTGIAAGGGGGAGGTSISWFNATEMGANATYTIGGGGGGGANTGGTGTTGTDTTFNPAGTGTTLTASGGVGGVGLQGTSQPHVVAGGNGGAASGGDANAQGGGGTVGISFEDGNNAASFIEWAGNGGTSIWGGGPQGAVYNGAAAAAAGTNGTAYGTGGTGGYNRDTTTGVTGGDGKIGVCVVEEFGD